MKKEYIESIFKVIIFKHRYCNKRLLHYPKFKLSGDERLYFKNIDEVERYIKEQAQLDEKINSQISLENDLTGVYAYVVIEVPLAMEINDDVLCQYLSLRIYLRDGSLWGRNNYANFIPHHGNSQLTMFWRAKNVFGGRKPEEIKYKPGDIVEILGCPGNDYWSNNRVDLAIVVGTPETVDQVAERKTKFIATHDGFDISEVGLAYEFNAHHDTYEVIPYGCDFVDHAPTICVFNLTRSISSRRRKALQAQYDNYLKKKIKT